MAQVTQADIIRLCTDFESQNGIIALLTLLEDIIEARAQASGVVLLDVDDEDGLDAAEIAYFTAH